MRVCTILLTGLGDPFLRRFCGMAFVHRPVHVFPRASINLLERCARRSGVRDETRGACFLFGCLPWAVERVWIEVWNVVFFVVASSILTHLSRAHSRFRPLCEHPCIHPAAIPSGAPRARRCFRSICDAIPIRLPTHPRKFRGIHANGVEHGTPRAGHLGVIIMWPAGGSHEFRVVPARQVTACMLAGPQLS